MLLQDAIRTKLSTKISSKEADFVTRVINKEEVVLLYLKKKVSRNPFLKISEISKITGGKFLMCVLGVGWEEVDLEHS